MTTLFRKYPITLLLLMLLISGVSHAHAPRENYVWLNVETDHVSGRFELNVNDIKRKLGLEVDKNAETRETGVAQTSARVQQYLAENFALSDSAGELPYTFVGTGVSAEADDFAQYYFRTARLPDSDRVTIENTVFLTADLAKTDRLHRSLIVLEYNKSAGKDFGVDTPYLVFSPAKTTATLDTVNPSRILQWKDFLLQGVLHIWMGIDHVLFILVLLVTTVLIVSEGKWQPINNFRAAFIKTLKVITLFTIAHSITLSLAAFGLVSLNSAFIETVIAISIIVVALNNIYPVFNSHAWVWVFTFGLFHGLGFASVMADLQFRTVMLGKILVMFNVGVEIGQFVIVLLVFPLFFLVRKSRIYRQGVVIPLSVLAILIASYWAIERTGLLEYVV